MMAGVVQVDNLDLPERREIRVRMVCLDSLVEKVRRVCQVLMVYLACLEQRVTEVCSVMFCFSCYHSQIYSACFKSLWYEYKMSQ